MMRFLYNSWIWPAIILCSVVLVGLAVFCLSDSASPPLDVFWFLFVCPGAALMRFFRIQEPVTVGTLAVAISLSLDALVAGCQMYAGHWSPDMTLTILMALTVVCLLLQH